MTESPARRRRRSLGETTAKTRVENPFFAARKLAGLSAIAILVGLALVGTGEISLGPLVVIAGLLLAIYAAHRLGRSGPDLGRL
jgi:hypothetical protein